jgi:hypothetical protein
MYKKIIKNNNKKIKKRLMYKLTREQQARTHVEDRLEDALVFFIFLFFLFSSNFFIFIYE